MEKGRNWVRIHWGGKDGIIALCVLHACMGRDWLGRERQDGIYICVWNIKSRYKIRVSNSISSTRDWFGERMVW